MDNRASGVLLHMTSLPGDYGIGTLGRAAFSFCDQLASMGFSHWQVLPLGHTHGGNSPYTCFSAFAGNPLLIDLELLVQQGLLDAHALQKAPAACTHNVDYAWVQAHTLPLLRQAFARADDTHHAAVRAFARRNPWLSGYASFMAQHTLREGMPWPRWPSACELNRETLAPERRFWTFVQWLFFEQWHALKSYANARGIRLIGDMPIYPDHQSADVWAHPGEFLLDETHRPTLVAGVPPDYFCADGQLWGNVLYNWEAMRQNDYAWWLARIGHSRRLYDLVRIDHFRAFSAFWAVRPHAKTARNGRWVPGPRMDLFEKVTQTFGTGGIIAEDLGVITPDVAAFVKATGFPGMRVLQFAFDGDDSPHLPHNHTANTVAYSGTHDNNTLLGWLWEAAPSQRANALSYCHFVEEGQGPGGDWGGGGQGSGGDWGTDGNPDTGGNWRGRGVGGSWSIRGDWGVGGPRAPGVRALLRGLWQSPAELVIVPIQDLLGYGGDTRMNIPGTPEGNWRFRVTADALAEIDTQGMLRLNHVYHRG